MVKIQFWLISFNRERMDTRQFMARPERNHMIVCSSVLLVCFLAVTFQVMFFLSPFGLFEPSSHSSAFPILSSSKLQQVVKLGEGMLKQPEDVAFDKTGVLYTVARDGYIRRLYRNGTWDIWWHIDSSTLFGITLTKAGELVICDAEKGLLKVSDDGVTVLASHVRFADDVVESSDGTLYFSVASSKYSYHDFQLDLFDVESNGQLLQYDPSLNGTTILLDNLGLANGVAVSADQDYLIVCETWKFRCSKYWLEGENKGKTEIFIDDLPGCPDNINLAPDGSFWIALIKVVPSRLRFVHTSEAAKLLIRTIPGLGKRIIKLQKKAMVVNVDGEGNIIRGFDDPTGLLMRAVTSAVEFEQHLYLASMYSDFIVKLPLID